MNYYLAYFREYGKEDGFYRLVKADSKQEAYEKAKKSLILQIEPDTMILITEAIE